MTFRPCFVVPAFDPGPALAETLRDLAAYGLPIYVTDDGSGEAARTLLRDLARREPLVRPSRFETNQGKGAAVADGLRRAARDGFTHALQVDADHQHDLRAVPTFLEAGERNPGAVIAGYPVFDATAPSSRKYGRWANDLWVHINTLSYDIRDSLCGFRLYPLAPALRLLDRRRIARRMAFDTEIAIRMHWEGVPFISLPVGVTYPEGGASHFRAFWDTFRLVVLHHILFFTMIPRSPWLIARARPERRPWHRVRERGGPLGLRFMLWSHRILGPRVVRAIARLVTPYFYLTSGSGRRASRDYLERLSAFAGPLPDIPGPVRAREVYRHFRAFSRSTTDTFLAWCGRGQDLKVAFPDIEAFLALRRSGTGAIFLCAHLGSLEMIRALGVGRGLTGLNAVVHSDNALRFHDVLRRANPDFAMDLVQASQVTPETAMVLQEKVGRGEFLFIAADRTPPSENGRTVLAPFLGRPAPFPLGPYLLAHLLKCPVHLLDCRLEGDAYRVRLEPFAARIDLPRKGREEALAAWAARYARHLEDRCRETPFQWFNYFDFWRSHPKR